jgi:HSP20 family protein
MGQAFGNQVERDQRWKPLSRVQEKENFFHLALDIPGVDQEHLKVDLKENILNISGERKNHFKNEDEEVDSFLRFEQKFSLPQGINPDEIEVHQENGVLDIIIPKLSKKNESKSIEVKVGKSQHLV